MTLGTLLIKKIPALDDREAAESVIKNPYLLYRLPSSIRRIWTWSTKRVNWQRLLSTNCVNNATTGVHTPDKTKESAASVILRSHIKSEMRCTQTSRSFVFSVVVLQFSGAIVHRITPSACGYSRAGAWVIPDPYIFCLRLAPKTGQLDLV